MKRVQHFNDILKRFEKIVLKSRYLKKIPYLNNLVNYKDDEVTVMVEAFNNDKKNVTKSHGLKIGKTSQHFTISGAKGHKMLFGKKNYVLSSLAMSEVSDRGIVGLAVAYGKLYKNGKSWIDIKVNDDKTKNFINEYNELIITGVKGEKVIFQDADVGAGKTVMFKMTVGSNFISLTIKELAVGVNVEYDQIISKSVIKVKNYTVT